jgi:hypothetical protein
MDFCRGEKSFAPTTKRNSVDKNTLVNDIVNLAGKNSG